MRRSLPILTALVIVFLAVALAAVSADAAPSASEAMQIVDSPVDGDNSSLMLDRPVGELSVVGDARWSSRFTDHSLIALIWWVIALLALHIAGLPWALQLFPRIGSRAAGLARLIAWLLAAWLVWILASLEIIAFRAIWCGVALALVGAAGWIWRKRRHPERAAWRDIVDSLRSGPEYAFTAVFSVFLLFRFINPDSWHPIWGGEKPMEFAHINAMLRTAHFPPFDPWFSGGILNYYYYGSYLVAYLIKLTGIPSEIAFNLAQPTVMGLLGAGVYTVVSVLVTRDARSRAATVGGGVGVVVLLFMGNLVAARNAIRILPDLPEPNFIEWTWNPSRAIAGAITEFPYFTGLYADLHAHVVALPITVLVIAGGLELALRRDSPVITLQRFVVEQMPLLALMGLALGTLSATNAWDVPLYAVLILASLWLAAESLGRLQSSLVAVALLAAGTSVLGMAAFLPFHRHYVALFNTVEKVRAPTAPGEWFLHVGGLLALLVIGLAWLAASQVRPVSVTSVHRAAFLALGIALGSVGMLLFVRQSLGRASGSPLWPGLVSIAILILVAWLIVTHAEAPGWLFAGLAVAVAATVGIVGYGWTVLAIGLSIAILGGTFWWLPVDPVKRYTGLLIAAAGAAVAGLELVYVVDDLSPDPLYYRMNSMFKIYNEVWVTLGIAAAAVVARCVAAALDQLDDRSTETETVLQCSSDLCVERPRTRTLPIALPLACVALVTIGAGLVYPVLATGPRLDQRFGGHPSPNTLNALNWMDYGTITTQQGDVVRFDSDRAAIDWFNNEIAGTPVIAEASIGAYRGNGSRISNATGLPTVLGWYRHQLQQRYQGDLDVRYRDLLALYNSADVAERMRIIEEYGIEYIVVGDVERYSVVNEATGQPFASAEGLAIFENMLGTELEIAFRSGSTVVYRVVGSE
ncbi:MAG: hypothetical protein IT335_07260 [Thermomicrobiales bacterium]|nr:hypothetical protein [Thermomicrobiales bacterium]